ncbi:hypothetical protein O7626_08365 [Micromonospora sp. WMMD1102]|uniref:hypothetical protein n=1 Tax=Micromonospora sp. WMMD1102 TaxID=3016105 RepID=UPI002414F1B4|nr:hypothetical protein [Micromonospora sp. WMMD1102]MDG4785939.1 hypothetical protein [Micromonospora sp. WMMD1102]
MASGTRATRAAGHLLDLVCSAWALGSDAMNRAPVPGDVVGVGPAANIQFRGERKLVLRVVAVDSRPTYYGWAWIAGYVLGRNEIATDKREIYVQVAGLKLLRPAARRI